MAITGHRLVGSRSVVARNWATSSSNRIHSDDVAAQYGFRGGLVPGVTTIAYLLPGVIRALGGSWLYGGALSARLTVPVYDGETITVDSYDDGVVRVVGSAGDDDRVVATARLETPFVVDVASFPARPLPVSRPPAGPEVLAPGVALGTVRHTATVTAARQYLAAINDAFPCCGDVALPVGWALLDANEVLVANVVLGPWIHVQSDIHVRGPIPDGAQLETRALVTAEYEKKGHRFVELDVLVLANMVPVVLVHHTALYRLRPPAVHPVG